MTSVIRSASIVAVLCLSFALAACNADRLALTLQAAIAATEAALPLVTAAGVPAEVTAQIQEYLDAVNDGAIKSTAILANNGYTPAEKASAITVAFTAIALPKLPPGTPQNVALSVNTVASAVGVFLAAVRTTEAEIRFSHPELVTGFDKPPVRALTAKELNKLRRRAERAKRKIAASRRKV